MAVRLFVDRPLRDGETLALPPGPARHVQVLRLQPGAALTLFNGRIDGDGDDADGAAGRGFEWEATVLRIGRSEVEVRVGTGSAVDRELAVHVTLALGMPANERMDFVVEKATELGVAAIQPLVCERSVLRLAGERAEKKRSHWQAVAEAACEQSGRTRVPWVGPVRSLADWLAGQNAAGAGALKLVMSLGAARPLAALWRQAPAVIALSGPEGGLSDAEEALALRGGFVPVSLGRRVLRADTAPLALLACVALGGVAGEG